MKTHGIRFFAILIGTAALGGCATAPATPEVTLYERLGGKPAIEAVVGDFLAKVGSDSRVRHQPRPERVPALKILLTDLVCEATGGPCTYTGRDMKSAHAGMGITGAEFDAIVDDLVRTLNEYKVPEREKSDLLALLGPMRRDIAETP